MIIKFTKSPTGVYNLAYNIGGVMDCKDTTLANKLIKDGYAIEVKQAVKTFKKRIK